jgi:membrane protease YdiL (CAAX protease family)
MGYFSAVRHPWPCLVFLIPLLGVYEIGVVALRSDAGSEEWRAGVDVWLRHFLTNHGVQPLAVIPGVIIGLLGLWCFATWKERPERVLTSVFGIVIESVLFGLGLWTLCSNAPYLAERIGIPVAALGPEGKAKVVTFIGVGIYEEVVFRLILFAGLAQLLRYLLIPGIATLPMAALASSLAFAWAHHIDVQSDPYIPLVFATRVMIGLYCAILFWWRGLGVVVGTHIVYDLVVGLR